MDHFAFNEDYYRRMINKYSEYFKKLESEERYINNSIKYHGLTTFKQKPTVLNKPKRTEPINQDDITNLKIAMETMDFETFLENS